MKTCCCECAAFKTGRAAGESCRWFNYQQPDRRLFTNTWLCGGRVSLVYLCLRWTIALAMLFALFQPLLSRVIHAPRTSWQYLLYLAHWVRLLAFLHHTTEAVLVSLRYRAELKGQEDIRNSPGYSSGPSSPSLPWTHKMLWTFANISSEVSVLCTLVYWPFIYRPEHGLSLENLVGHGVITGINIMDVFISSRPWRCLHVYQTQLFCLTYSLSSLVTVEEEGNSEGASIDLPYSYSLLPGEPSHALITILGIMLILPFIHLFFILLYKLRCSLVKVMGKGDLIHGKGRKEGEGVEMVEAGQGLLTAN